MAVNSNNQANIAFKNLLGRSVTDTGALLSNEPFGIFFNVSSSDVWTSAIPFDDPSAAVSNGSAVYVEADMSIYPASNGYSFLCYWPSSAPAGTDPLTSTPFAYNTGSLAGINAGDRVKNIISEPKHNIIF